MKFFERINKKVVAIALTIMVAFAGITGFVGCTTVPPGGIYTPSPAVAVAGTAVKFGVIFLHRQIDQEDFDMAVNIIKTFRTQVTDNSTVQENPVSHYSS